MPKHHTNNRPTSAIRLVTGTFLTLTLLATQARSQVADPPALSAAAKRGEAARQPVTRQDLNQAMAVFDELNEQIRIAAAKLDPESLGRKEEIGKLQTLLVAIDEQIQLESTAVGRLEERFRQLQQDLSASDQGSTVSPESKLLLEKSRVPIESATARLERLANFRVRTRQRLSLLQREHIQALLAAIVSPVETKSEADDFEQLLEETLTAPAR